MPGTLLKKSLSIPKSSENRNLNKKSQWTNASTEMNQILELYDKDCN